MRDPRGLPDPLTLTEFDTEADLEALDEALPLLKSDDVDEGDCETESSIVRDELWAAENDGLAVTLLDTVPETVPVAISDIVCESVGETESLSVCDHVRTRDAVEVVDTLPETDTVGVIERVNTPVLLGLVEAVLVFDVVGLLLCERVGATVRVEVVLLVCDTEIGPVLDLRPELLEVTEAELVLDALVEPLMVEDAR